MGLGVGAALNDLVDEGKLGGGFFTRARIETAAAADARMSGHEVEVMASGGSGNQGIMASVPASVLAEELGLFPSEETKILFERIRAGEEIGCEPEAPLPPHNIPLQPTPFVGRETEQAELDRLVADPNVRLITILGPGGVGKTRLAVAAALDTLRRVLESAEETPPWLPLDSWRREP